MKQEFMQKSILVLTISLFCYLDSFGQIYSNALAYFNWNEQPMTSRLILDENKRKVSFKSEFMPYKDAGRGDSLDYKSNINENWRCTIFFDETKGKYRFRHVKNGDGASHESDVINCRDPYGGSHEWTLHVFENGSIGLVRNSSPSSPSTTASAQTGVVYVDRRMSEQCGCTSLANGNKLYLRNTTQFNYQVTVETRVTGHTNHTSNHIYVSKPGVDIFLGCSKTGGNQWCDDQDFFITNRVRQ